MSESIGCFENRIGSILCIAVIVAIAAGIGTPASANSGPKWVEGYYAGYDSTLLPPEDIDWNGLTQIVMGAAKAKPDGSIDTSFYQEDPAAGPVLATTISKYARENNTRPILMFGGAGDGADIAAAYQNNPTGLIANLTTTMKKYGYGGIDLDWEDSIDYAQFASFARDLRTSVKAADSDAILTMPVGCVNPNYASWNPPVVDPGIANVAQYVDQVNIMSYSPGTQQLGYGWWSWFNSPLTGEKVHTPVSIQNSLFWYNQSVDIVNNVNQGGAGIPDSKLGMGIGFYATGYAGNFPTITGPDDLTAGDTEAYNDNNAATDIPVGGDHNAYGGAPLSDFFAPGGDFAINQTYLTWSTEADEPYLALSNADPDPELYGAQFISFENPRSIIEKGNFTIDNGYGGVIIWTINEGYISADKTSNPRFGSVSDPNFLFEALQNGFIPPQSVTQVTPQSGPANSITNVTITGTGFSPGATGVTFGGIQATNVTVLSETQINATAPAQAAGTVDVVVSTHSGFATGPKLYTYTAAPAPASICLRFKAPYNIGNTAYYYWVCPIPPWVKQHLSL